MADEGFGGVGEVGDAVGDVAAGDMFPGGCSKDFPEHLLPGTTGGRKPFQIVEGFLRFPGEGVPVGLAEVSEGVMGRDLGSPWKRRFPVG